MNKQLLNQLRSEERRVAERITIAGESMKLAESFQWNLEAKLMEAYPSRKQHSLWLQVLKPAAWTVVMIAGILLLNWIMRTSLPSLQPLGGATPTQELSFESKVRAGNLCVGPLAVEHGFAVFLTNPEKTQFVAVDAAHTIGELRSFAWSADGNQLAILGNTTGRGNIYLTDSSGSSLQPVLANSELGYMMDAAWSGDGRQFVLWSAQNNKVLYLLNSDGTGLVEKQLNVQILGAPQFAPDGQSIVFYGATSTSSGLFEFRLADSQALLINISVEGPTSFAFSADGSHLAYMEYDHEMGTARLLSEDRNRREITMLGSLPIPRGSGSSVPDTAHLSWSADSKSLVFDFGRGSSDRVIYLARADGTALSPVVNSGYAPSLSFDGACLAYIRDKEVFLLDLSSIPSASAASTPLLVADLPAGRALGDYRLDKLQWRPGLH